MYYSHNGYLRENTRKEYKKNGFCAILSLERPGVYFNVMLFFFFNNIRCLNDLRAKKVLALQFSIENEASKCFFIMHICFKMYFYTIL